MTILAMVTADKEGQIESRMMKSRQLEEIREARKKEAELRQEQKKSRLVRWYLTQHWIFLTIVLGGNEGLDQETEETGKIQRR